jgi:hypothetical protein
MPSGADAAVADARAAGLSIAYIRLDEAEVYHCSLRRLGDVPFLKTERRTVYVRRGRGKTIEAAIRDAMADDFADILG